MKPIVKANPLIFQDKVNTHNFNLESYLVKDMIPSMDCCYLLSSFSHDPLSLLDHDQYLSNSLDCKFSNLGNDQVQGSHISWVEEKRDEYSLDLSFLFQNSVFQDIVPLLFANLESSNLSSQPNEINFLDESKFLGNHHHHHHDPMDVHDDECPSEPTDISISKEYFGLKYLYLEYDSVKDVFLMETSSSTHHSLCHIACDKNMP